MKTTNYIQLEDTTKEEKKEDGDDEIVSNVSYSFITKDEFRKKTKWFEVRLEGKKRWIESRDNQTLLEAYMNRKENVTLSDGETCVDLTHIIEETSHDRVSLQDVNGKEDVFVVGTAKVKTRGSKHFQVRMMCIANGVFASNVQIQRPKSGILKTFDALKGLTNLWSRKKNTKDSDVDSKIWFLFRQKRYGKGFAKLNLVEMYTLLRFLEPQDLARIQECSRAFCFVAGQEALWSRLASWRKQYPRLTQAFALHGQVQQLQGKEYLKCEIGANQLQKRHLKNLRRLEMIGVCREHSLYPISCTITNKSEPYHIAIGLTLVCCIIAGLPAVILFAKRADDKESDGDWTPWLIPTYIGFLPVVLCLLVFLCGLFSSNSYWGRELQTMRCFDFTCIFIFQWLGRAAMIICFVCVTWFARNLSAIGDDDEDAPKSYNDAFKPLFFAEASLLVLFLVGLIADWSTDSFFRLSMPFRYFIKEADDEDDAISTSRFCTWLGAMWIINLLYFSIQLSIKLDDDDSSTWDEVFVPIWIGYSCHFLAVLSSLFCSKSEGPAIVSLISAVLSVYGFVSVILIQVKLVHDNMSWLETMIPMIIFFSLICCIVFLSVVLSHLSS